MCMVFLQEREKERDASAPSSAPATPSVAPTEEGAKGDAPEVKTEVSKLYFT